MSIYGAIYNELQAYTAYLPRYNTKIAKSVYDALDREAIADIILDGKTFWFETYQYGKGLTNAQHDWLVRFLKQHGYQYLYEL